MTRTADMGAVEKLRAYPHVSSMTITLPDIPALDHSTVEDILLDLAYGGSAAGHLSRQSAANVAGVSRRKFDEALYRRRIPSYTAEMLSQDLDACRSPLSEEA